MKHQASARFALAIIAGTLICSLAASPAGAEEKKALSAAGGMREALTRVGSGQKAEIGLRNGKSYAGVLGEIGEQLVVVQQLSGKEFYDALIRLDDISSIEVRVR